MTIHDAFARWGAAKLAEQSQRAFNDFEKFDVDAVDLSTVTAEVNFEPGYAGDDARVEFVVRGTLTQAASEKMFDLRWRDNPPDYLTRGEHRETVVAYVADTGWQDWSLDIGSLLRDIETFDPDRKEPS